MSFQIYTEPMAHFRDWYAQAQQSDMKEPTAVNLATVGQDGRPTNRTVLLKGLDDAGFVIYTNYESVKAKQMLENPHASLCFYWMHLTRQVRVEGVVERATEAESDAYFASRARQSQIGAWASRQSQVMPHADAMDARIAEIEQRFAEKDVPRPEHWGGFRIVPERVEFWQEGPFRLHERMHYRRAGQKWKVEHLYP